MTAPHRPHCPQARTLLAVPEWLCASRDVVKAEPCERRGESTFGFRNGRVDDLIENARAVSRTVVILNGAGSAQDIADADPLALARKFVAAARATQAVEDARMHERLQHRLEMARWKVMARCEFACRHGPFPCVQRNVDDSSDGK